MLNAQWRWMDFLPNFRPSVVIACLLEKKPPSPGTVTRDQND